MLEGIWADELEVVYGDKAYLSKINVTYIHSLSAKAVIEPKRGLTGKAHGHRDYARLVKEYPGNPRGWREKNEYEKRSLVESVFGAVKVKLGGTLRSRCDNRSLVETVFSMMKLRFGGGLSSRRCREQRKELLIMVILHDIRRVNFLECARR